MPNFTLEGHEKGVNCVDYFTGADRTALQSPLVQQILTGSGCAALAAPVPSAQLWSSALSCSSAAPYKLLRNRFRT
jgi:hypothetical protein